MNTKNTAAAYVVRTVTVVDRPALRGTSFPAVPAGTVVTDYVRCRSQSGAVAYRDAVLRGEYDFSSEYVRSVEVYQERPGRRARTVRKRTDREAYGARRALESVLETPELRRIALAVAAQRRGNTLMHMSAHWDRALLFGRAPSAGEVVPA